MKGAIFVILLIACSNNKQEHSNLDIILGEEVNRDTSKQPIINQENDVATETEILKNSSNRMNIDSICSNSEKIVLAFNRFSNSLDLREMTDINTLLAINDKNPESDCWYPRNEEEYVQLFNIINQLNGLSKKGEKSHEFIFGFFIYNRSNIEISEYGQDLIPNLLEMNPVVFVSELSEFEDYEQKIIIEYLDYFKKGRDIHLIKKVLTAMEGDNVNLKSTIDSVLQALSQY
jgi:hypothetical protein